MSQCFRPKDVQLEDFMIITGRWSSSTNVTQSLLFQPSRYATCVSFPDQKLSTTITKHRIMMSFTSEPILEFEQHTRGT